MLGFREYIQFSYQNLGCTIAMNKDFTFTIKRSCFDAHYNPAENTRITNQFREFGQRGKPRGQLT
ncbi:hypothetical protein DMB90_12555 [Raoultella planticola]|uniref:Uncharacterized protein n=1 Tax=Raoultella planticola TaxID=575 RepID=A0A5P6A9W8_RAOPL|nr:hypothetical protein DMB90_12555 [Raoultella planticola]